MTWRALLKRRDLCLGLALLLALLAAWPLLVLGGIVNTRAGGDSLFLVQRVQQLAQALRAGHFPVRWMPDGAHGLGYPFFNFYAALPYYLAAALDLAGAGVLGSIKLTQAVGFVLAGLWMYRLARALGGGPVGALVASAAYNLAPFHLVNVYVRGDALSEFYAYAFYPLILYAALRLSQRPTPERAALLAASYALLVLSHNISALIFSPLVGMWLVVVALFGAEGPCAYRGREGWRALGAGLAALGLGLVLSAWYWLPALREQPFVQLQDQTTGYFHFAGHFRGANLVQPRLMHDYTIAAPRDPFSVGLAQGALALGGMFAWGWRVLRTRRVAGWQLVALLALGGYTWVTTPSSRWVWDRVPLLPYAQFPWRLLAVQALTIALLAAGLPDPLPGRWATGVGLALTALVALAGLAGLRVDRLPLHESEITPTRLMLYETYSGNLGTTIRHEYLPREMVPRPFLSAVQSNGGEKPAPLVLAGQLRTARLLRRTPTAEQWTLDVAQGALLAFHTAYYPGWRAWVDGQPASIEPLAGLGLIGLRLAPGAHEVMLRWGETTARRLATTASGGGLLVLLGLVIYPARRARRYRYCLAGAGVLIALAYLWLRLAPSPAPGEPPAGPRVMDFVRAPYLHAEPEGVDFGAAWLAGYTLSTTQPGPGEAVRLNTTWRAPCPECQARVELAGAVAHLFEHSPVWAEASAPLGDREVPLILRLPPELPPGLYVVRLSVRRGGQPQPARSAQGQPLGAVALEPLQVVADRLATGQEPILAAFGPELAPPAIALVGAQAVTLPQGLVEVTLTWRAERQAPLNYMLSVRLNHADGRRIAARDLPPLLAGYPTSLWRAGELVTDRIWLPVGALPAGEYALEIVLYDRLTLKAAGTAIIQGIALPTP